MYCVVYQRYNCWGNCNIRIFRSCANSHEILYSVCLNCLWTIKLSSQTHLGCSCSASPGVLQISACTRIPTSLPEAPANAACSGCDVPHLTFWTATVCSVLCPGHCALPYRQLQLSVRWNNSVSKHVFRPFGKGSGFIRPIIISLFYFHRNI